MQDTFLVVRFHAARLLCRVGEWFIERGLEVAGDGYIDVQFEIDQSKPLPWWCPITVFAVLTAVILSATAIAGGQ